MERFIIENESCLGDKWHNEAIKKIDSASGPWSKRIKDGLAFVFDNQLERYNERAAHLGLDVKSVQWCGIEKQEAARYYALANSKTLKTYKKRLIAMRRFLEEKEHYGALFNKQYIDMINSEIEYFKNCY